MRIWYELTNEHLGFLQTLSAAISSAETRHPGIIPDLRTSKTLFVGSDYSGEHKSAHFETISFLAADLSSCIEFQSGWQSLRKTYLPDGRRLGFKDLKDRKRQSALFAFLDRANAINGLLITFAIRKNVGSLFTKSGKLKPEEFAPLGPVSAPVAEKMLRVAHLLGIILAGLSGARQNVLWVTDDDAIAANENRLRSLCELLGYVCSKLLAHELGQMRVGASSIDPGDRSIEDLLSIVDFTAGMVVHLLDGMFGNLASPVLNLFFPIPDKTSAKAYYLANWFTDNGQPLKRLVILVEESQPSKGLRASHLWFHSAADLFKSVAAEQIGRERR